jgi:glycosyltransferase involved in cell wall biosynthesis
MDMSTAKVCILLAVYNGAAHIASQLDSILAQDHTNWELFIRDDGSLDGSQKIVQAYAKQDPRIFLIKDNEKNKGARGNFSILMEKAARTPAHYVAFSDQDDVWQPEKLSAQIRLMRRTEESFPAAPVLVHSDMAVVSENLASIAPSFMKYQGIRHTDSDPLKVLLIQNFITGCTVMINRRLLDTALPVPKSALMHDWWLGLCAASMGVIRFIDKPLVMYRQHDSNAVGAKPLLVFLHPKKTSWTGAWLSGLANLRQSVCQARSLAQRIMKHDRSNETLFLVEAYASLPAMPPLARVMAVMRKGFLPQTRPRRLLAVSRLFFLSEKR